MPIIVIYYHILQFTIFIWIPVWRNLHQWEKNFDVWIHYYCNFVLHKLHFNLTSFYSLLSSYNRDLRSMLKASITSKFVRFKMPNITNIQVLYLILQVFLRIVPRILVDLCPPSNSKCPRFQCYMLQGIHFVPSSSSNITWNQKRKGVSTKQLSHEHNKEFFTRVFKQDLIIREFWQESGLKGF